MNNIGALTGKTAIVTGSTRGIGRAIAERFLAEGAKVIIHGRSEETAKELARNFDDQAIGIGGEIGQTATAQKLIDTVNTAWGKIDILVNNAGIARDGYLTRITDEDWDQSIAVNLSGTFQLMRAAVPHMKSAGSGSIVNVTSYAGVRGSAGQAAYSASKAGQIGLTLAAAKELARFSIRVNALAPSARTDMTDQMGEEQFQQAVRQLPMRRIATLDEVTESALFLASDRSSATTGQILHADCGGQLR